METRMQFDIEGMYCGPMFLDVISSAIINYYRSEERLILQILRQRFGVNTDDFEDVKRVIQEKRLCRA